MTYHTYNLNHLQKVPKIPIDDVGRLQRYLDLSLKNLLENEDDIEFISEILYEAESDEILAFILDKIDRSISLGEIQDLEVTMQYSDKQPWLSEYLTCVDPEFYVLLQEKLSLRHYYNGPLDGILGKRTKAAIKQFKSENEIHEDNVLGPETVRKILTVS